MEGLSLMQWLTNIVNEAQNFLFTYVLIALLLIVGLYFTIRSGVVQLTLLKDSFKTLMDKKGVDKNEISSFQSLMISTASRVGTGNIAGVATAIMVGGPGAVFWMWIIALIGSASAFVESTLAQVYKQKEGSIFIGGPAYYIKNALGNKTMAVLFAISLILCFGVGFNGLQSFNIASSLSTFHDGMETKVIVGIVLALLSGIIIFGGIHRIGVISSIVVPIMAGVYILLGLYVIITNINLVPGVMSSIFNQALSFQAFASGALGAAILQGVKRGLFSNEAGMGSSPNAAASADVTHPVKQGLAQVISVFIDTFLICTTSAVFVLLSKNASGDDGIKLIQDAFLLQFGDIGIYFITIAIILFAFTSIIGNYSYVESNFLFMCNSKKALNIFRIICLVPIIFGALIEMDLAWALADLFMGIMALINIWAIVSLSKVAFICLKDYKQQRAKKLDPTFDPKSLGIKNTKAW